MKTRTRSGASVPKDAQSATTKLPDEEILQTIAVEIN
jgi:hypothetical protein